MTREPTEEKGVQSPYGLETQVGDLKSTGSVTFTDKNLHDIIRYAVVGIYRVTAAGIFLFANAKLAEIFGYPSVEQFFSEVSNILELYANPEDREPILQRMIAEGYVDDAEAFFKRKDGQLIWVRIRARVILQGNGEEPVYEGFMVDISEQKQAQDHFRQSEARYRSLYAKTPVMLHSIDHRGRFLSVSDWWLEVFGYERDEVIGRNLTDFMTEESRRYAESVILPQFFKTGQVKDIPYQMVKKTEEVIDVLLSASGERDGNGEIFRTLAVLIDVTEKKKTEAELERHRKHLEEMVHIRTQELEAVNRSLMDSESQYRITVESAPCGVLVHDAEDRILIFNAQLEAVTGYTKAEIPDSPTWFEKLYPEAGYRQQMLADRKVALRKGLGRVRTREATITRKDGTERVCRFTSIRLASGNRIVFIMDVTDQVRAEAELRKSHEELEKRVRQRTAQLETVNRELAQEVAWRQSLLEALQKSEANYRGIVETQTELICRMLPDGEITFVNTAICRAMGLSSQELVGQKFYQYVHPEDRETIRNRLESLSAENPIVENEERVLLPDGRQRWWHWINQAMFDENGRVREIQAVGRDISAIKEAEAKVRESEFHVRSLMESAVNFAVYRLRADDEDPLKVRKVFVSPSIEDIIGIPNTVDHSQWYDTIHPDDVARVREANFRAFETHRFDEIFRVYNAKKGEWRWIHVVSNGVLDAEGRAKFVNGIFIDVTDQKRAEQALRESEQRYRQLVETMGEGFVIQDEKDRVTYVNERLCKMLGHPKEELLGKKSVEVLSPESRRFFPKRLARRRKGRSETYEADLIRKNGERVPTIISARPLMDTGKRFMGSFAVVTDIRKIKETEQALRQREFELEVKSKSLEEVNTALRVLLDRRNEDKGQIEEKVLSNVKQLVAPYLEKLTETKLDSRQRSFVDVLASNLNDIISPFTRSLSSKYMLLTPTEIQIANLLRQGQTTKDIAEMLGVSERTVETHRRNIRKKLGLNDRKANLRTHLLSID